MGENNEAVKIPNDVENQEALLVLEIARAQRDVHHAEKALAECVVRQHEKIADLHRFKAVRMQDTVDDKDLNIGWINALFSNHSRVRPIPIARASTHCRLQSDEDGELFPLTFRKAFLIRHVRDCTSCCQWAVSCCSA